MNRRGWYALMVVFPYVMLYTLSWYHIWRAPYTKVEESFNVQAVHDILYLGVGPQRLENRDQMSAMVDSLDDLYDHIAFPGVVPRTFLGPLVISLIVKPCMVLFGWNLGHVKKVVLLMVARGVLAGLVCLGLWFFGTNAIPKMDNRAHSCYIQYIFAVLCMIQFHLPFYMSRMLPNTFALVLTCFGFGYWMRVLADDSNRATPETGKVSKNSFKTVALLTCAAIVFRCDAIIVVGLVGIHMVLTRRVTLVQGISLGVLSCLVSLVVTVLVDSYFWRRWLWPEGEVLYFNTVLNKSKEWGVSPMNWYFTSALPRMLHVAYPMAFLGALVDARARSMMTVAVGFVALYSFLEHKEARFLYVTLPLWNMSAAIGLHALFFVSRSGSVIIRGLRVCCLVGIGMGLVLTFVSSAASYANYPGGVGLVQGIKMVQQQKTSSVLRIHIDTLAATTGVSRFLQEPDGNTILYSKEEGIALDEYQHRDFDYLLNEHHDVPGYILVEKVPGFDRIEIDTSLVKQCITRERLVMIPHSLMTMFNCIVSHILERHEHSKQFFTVEQRDVLFFHKKAT